MPSWFFKTSVAVSLTMLAASAHAADAEKGDKELPLFASEPFPFVWNLLMFLILLGVLWKFVWPTVLGGLQAREQKQRDDLASAERASKEAAEALAQRQEELARAQQDAQAVIEKAKQDALEIAAKIKSDAEASAAALTERNKAEIEAAKEQALSELYAQTAELSTQIAGRILKREISAADQQQLVSESLAELTRSGV